MSMFKAQIDFLGDSCAITERILEETLEGTWKRLIRAETPDAVYGRSQKVWPSNIILSVTIVVIQNSGILRLYSNDGLNTNSAKYMFIKIEDED